MIALDVPNPSACPYTFQSQLVNFCKKGIWDLDAESTELLDAFGRVLPTCSTVKSHYTPDTRHMSANVWVPTLDSSQEGSLGPHTLPIYSEYLGKPSFFLHCKEQTQ